MVKTHKVRYIHLKRGSKRNILGYIARVHTKTGTQQSGHQISESFTSNPDQFPFSFRCLFWTWLVLMVWTLSESYAPPNQSQIPATPSQYSE